MFTLTYHLAELNPESAQMLVRQLETLLRDETNYRGVLYGTGVQDIGSHAVLASEGKMSEAIDDKHAAFDDQRVCGEERPGEILRSFDSTQL